MTAVSVAEDVEAQQREERPRVSKEAGKGSALDVAQRETVDGFEFLTVPVSLGRISLPEEKSSRS